MPSEKKLLQELEKETVDTSRWMVGDVKEAEYQRQKAEGQIYGLAIPRIDGTLRAWHVADDPGKVVDLLEKKGDFYVREGDLCGGLYVSAVPHYWEGRSQKKWDFLPKMSKESRLKLYEAIDERLVEQINTGYITRSEFERASQGMEMAKKQDFWQILDIVANQPFNINIAKMAEALGLATPFKPPYIQVDFVGRYLEFNTRRAIEANEALLRLKYASLEGLTRLDLCNMLKDYGWDGVFTKAGFGTNPELVIWSSDKILTFGDWIRPSGATLGVSPREAIWFVDPMGESRFEAVVSPDRTRSMIMDKLLKQSFDLMSRKDVEHLERILESIGFGDPEREEIGRFQWSLLYGTPQIKDNYHEKYFRGLRPQDLDQLEGLISKVLEMMI